MDITARSSGRRQLQNTNAPGGTCAMPLLYLLYHWLPTKLFINNNY